MGAVCELVGPSFNKRVCLLPLYTWVAWFERVWRTTAIEQAQNHALVIMYNDSLIVSAVL